MTKPRAYDRVVKGRTAKQIAAAKQYSAREIAPTLPPPADMPATASWWIGLDRQQLREQVAEHQRRMRVSRYGRLKTSPE